ncbi:MAG: hypothetical protein JW767_04720 [Thermoleophilia bacterium]|nr:hypothetical protein [Thermoleophilia bacterium]
MSDAISATGILLKAGDGATPEQFVAVAELVTLKPPQLSRNEIEVTSHNEAVTSGEAKILGMLRKGQVTGTANWLPTDPTHSSAEGGAGMVRDLLDNKKRNWRIEFPPDGLPKWTFPARVQLIDPQEAPVDAALQFAFALTIDGAIVMQNE